MKFRKGYSMNYIKDKLNKNKSLLKILGLVMILGLIIGFFIYGKLDNSEVILNLRDIDSYLANNHISFIMMHLISAFIVVCGTAMVIGIVLVPVCFMLEGLTISYIFLALFDAFKFKGLVFGIFYIALTKVVYLILLFICFKKALNVVREVLKLGKNSGEEVKSRIISNIKGIVLWMFAILVNDILIYFLANKILASLLFIIK